MWPPMRTADAIETRLATAVVRQRLTAAEWTSFFDCTANHLPLAPNLVSGVRPPGNQSAASCECDELSRRPKEHRQVVCYERGVLR